MVEYFAEFGVPAMNYLGTASVRSENEKQNVLEKTSCLRNSPFTSDIYSNTFTGTAPCLNHKTEVGVSRDFPILVTFNVNPEFDEHRSSFLVRTRGGDPCHWLIPLDRDPFIYETGTLTPNRR